VHGAAHRDGVGEAVEAQPAAAREPPHPPAGRGHRERHEREPAQRAHRDVRPLHDLGGHLAEVQLEVERGVHHEVDGGVEEREEAEHPPVPRERVPAEEAPQRRHGQREGDEAERELAGGVLQRLHRLGAEEVGAPAGVDEEELHREHGEGERAEQEERGAERPRGAAHQ
jgi:hypothetical protein